MKASESLEKLCRVYWPPLYRFVLRRGHGVEDAKDLTQAFFAKLLERNILARADPDKGRFRSFLLKILKNSLADESDRARTAKRGGGVSFISFDEQAGEEHLLEKPGQNLTAEQQFDREWAFTVLRQAQAKLRDECAASGKSALFNRVVSLVDEKAESSIPDAVIAQELGMSVAAFKPAKSRLRARYWALVREEVAQTVSNPVSNPAEIDAELRYLLAVIGS